MQVRILLVLSFVFMGSVMYGQAKRFDTSMKIGKSGYKIYCSNKNAEKNSVTISPIGFENTAREITIEIKGRVNKAEVDDLNNDGFTDMVMFVNILGDKAKANVIGVSSDKNQGFAPIYFPDILDDQKLKAGYLGNDEYSLMEGTLMRRFPVYNTSDSANIKPSGTFRQIQYRVVKGDRGELKFKVSRSYEFTKQ